MCPLMRAEQQVLIGLGSNIHPQHSLQAGAKALCRLFPCIEFSPVYQTAAVGIEGADDFLNACALLQTTLPQAVLRQRLRAIEADCGRIRCSTAWRSRTLDLDILIYHGKVCDQDLYQYAHVFVPAADLVAMALPKDEQGLAREVALSLGALG